jgi:3-oxoacyl-[acyl-carrier protein] reductase
MDLGLRGMSSVVTGGSRGIGRAIALALADEGAAVAICARGEPALRETEAELRERGVPVFGQVCDVGDPHALGAFLDAARDALGGVDVFVHNASVMAEGPGIDAWRTNLRVDLMGAVHGCDRVMPWMAESGRGSVLFISSISAFDGEPAPDYAYASVKAALLAYARRLAGVWGPRGIRVNALAPGSIEFPGGSWEAVRREHPALYAQVRNSIPFGRLGTPEEVAAAAVFLVSPRANWITGVCLTVDGGQSRGG